MSVIYRFPSDGRLNKVRNYLYVKDHRGNTVLENREESKEIFKKTTARIMNKLLSEVVKCGTAKSVTLKEKYSIAGKTGTSGNNKDKLFIGYSPYFTAGIWCGYDNGRSIEGLSKSHLKIWDEIMTKIHEQTGKQPEKKFSEEELLNLPYCKDSGQIYCEKCLYDPRGDRMEYGYFTSDNMPVEECNVHVLVNYDTVEKGVAIRGCPEENLVKIALIKVSRDFPCEVIVTDAEFAFKNLNLYSKVPTEKYPYFYDPQNTEKFYGITDRKKQFNSACQKHS